MHVSGGTIGPSEDPLLSLPSPCAGAALLRKPLSFTVRACGIDTDMGSGEHRVQT